MRSNRSCSKTCLQFFTFLFIVNGLCLIGFGLWFLIDPAKRYLLDLVDFSEDDPLLRFATYTLLVSGAMTVFIALVGCCGSIKAGRFVIGSFMVLMICLLLSAVAVITLPILFKEKFANHRMPIYLANISQNRYYRDKWTTPLMDSIQFYQQCCGGKNGAKDYENSFWYLTNNERGTRSFVPASCCRQSQNGRAWNPQPIDPMCITYPYFSKAFNDSVNWRGCDEKLERTLDDLLLIFIVLGAISAGVILLGLLLSGLFCRRIRYYEYVPQ
ncbi:hypothetical protein M3Y95_00468700 [Aphelenchoides besseyi]|nr:hypothetical protein M3Y95_00468700 [Aphelenchoides besseyi]